MPGKMAPDPSCAGPASGGYEGASRCRRPEAETAPKLRPPAPGFGPKMKWTVAELVPEPLVSRHAYSRWQVNLSDVIQAHDVQLGIARAGRGKGGQSQQVRHSCFLRSRPALILSSEAASCRRCDGTTNPSRRG